VGLSSDIMPGQGVQDFGEEMSAHRLLESLAGTPFSGPDIFELYGWEMEVC